MSTLTFVYTGKCTHCGHKSCIVNEEESCNWDGCYECNRAQHRADLETYCSNGHHDWWRPTGGARQCITCGVSEEAIQEQALEAEVAEHRADGLCAGGYHFVQSVWDDKAGREYDRCLACSATSHDFGDTWTS